MGVPARAGPLRVKLNRTGILSGSPIDRNAGGRALAGRPATSHHSGRNDRTCKDYELLVLFTSTPGFPGDVRIAEAIKDSNPHIKIAFVGPHVSVLPEKSLMKQSD